MGDDWVCARCQSSNVGGNRFCGQCGTPLAAATAAVPAPENREERRQITVPYLRHEARKVLAEL